MSEGIGLGPYLLQERLGTGGMGAVYKALHAATRVPVAIKLVTRAGAVADAHIAALRHEAGAVARLRHPHIARVLDLGEVEGTAVQHLNAVPGSPYVVFELLEGGALHRVRPVRWPVARKILESLLAALAHAHAHGVIHRDVKPQNVLIGRGQPPWALKLTDFGIAWALRGTRTAGGTPGYMPPEQISGQWELQGPQTDLFAAGRLALFTLTGTPGGLAGKGPLVPAGFESWLDGLLAPDPADRWSLAADALGALRALGDPDSPLGPRGGQLHSSYTTVSMASFDSPEFDEVPMPVPPGPRPTPPWVGSWVQRVEVDHDSLDGADRHLFPHRATPVVGRHPQRDALWSALQSVFESGRPEVRVLVGPESSGRTRLARWLGERANELGLAQVVRGRGAAFGGAMAHSVRRWLRIDDTDADWVSTVPRSVSLRVQDQVQARVLRALAVGEGSGGALTQEWADWLGRVAVGRPVVAFLDELGPEQDPAAIVGAVLEGAVPALLLLTCSPDADWLQSVPPACRIALDPLDRSASRELLQSALALDPELCERIAELGQGLPGRLLGVLADLVEEGRLVPGRSGLRLADGGALPMATVGVRLERLLEGATEPAIRGLELAVCSLGEVDPRRWAEAAEHAGYPADEVLLQRLLAAGVVERERVGGPWRWTAPGVRQRLRERAAPRLAAHHRAWAAVLERPGEIGRHLWLAGEASQAVDYLLLGADRAQAVDRFERAASLLQLFDDAAASAGLDPGDPRRGAALFLSSRLAISRGRLELAEQLAADLDRDSEAFGWDDHRAKAWWLLGRMAMYRGQYAVADELLERALAWGVASGDTLLVGRSRFDLGQLSLQVRRSAEARERFAQARVDYDAAGFRPGVALAATFEVHAALQAGDLPAAKRAAGAAGQALVDAGALRAEAEHALMLGTIAVAEGDLDSAVLHLDRAVLSSGRITAVSASAVVNLAIVLDRLGRTAEVMPVLQPAMAPLARMDRWRMLGAAWAVLVSAAADLGDEAQFDAALTAHRAQVTGHDEPLDPEVVETLQRAEQRAVDRGWVSRVARIRRLLPGS